MEKGVRKSRRRDASNFDENEKTKASDLHLTLWPRAARAPEDVRGVQRLGPVCDGSEHARREHEVLGGDDDDRFWVVVVGTDGGIS